MSPEEKERNCPVCYMPLPEMAEKCPMCGTLIGKAGIVLPELKAKEKAPDRKDLTPEQREEAKAVMEELMAIPGMTPDGAFKLYQAGYRSLAELVKGAFHGDKEYTMTARLVANRIMAGAGEEKEEEASVHCPHCKSPVSVDDEICGVCGKDISAGIGDLDKDYVEMHLEEFTGNILEKLSSDSDFADMPEDLRSEIMNVMGTELEEPGPSEDEGLVMPEETEVDAKAAAIAAEVESQGYPAQAGEPPAAETAPKEAQGEETPLQPEAPADPDPEAQAKARYREKLRLWSAKGVDPEIIAELEGLLESDFDRFKSEAVKILRQRVNEMKAKKK